jgi:hypothetical protein
MTMTAIDTRAELDAAIDAHGANVSGARRYLNAAIDNHVAAEVARALAAAPGVEEAIGDVTVAWWDEAIRQCGRKEGFVIDEPDDRTTSGVALRAAIAADKARAVEAGISSAFAKLLPGRPTPDEARRLVAEFAGAHGAWMAHLFGAAEMVSATGDCEERTAAARTALLRALGVEA